MPRRCKCGCRREILPAAKCTIYREKLGFASDECQSKVAMANLKKIQAKNAQKTKAKVKQAKSVVKKRDADLKAKVNGSDIKHQLEITQKIFNRMRKLEEFYNMQNPACMSCEKPATKANLGEFCCGHYKTVGGFPELRFNTLNTWIQCNQYCNCRLSGNITGNKHTIGYRQGLRNRFDGAEKLMNYLHRPHKNYTRDCERLKVVRKWCAGRVRWLENRMDL
jgi:hypothetical protein